MLKKYRLKEFISILEQEEKQDYFNEKLCSKMLEQIKVLNDNDMLIVVLLDGSSLECENTL